jgi:hypothetical protein
MRIIGLTGFAKSGKSTAAQILLEMGGQEIAFAKHLKDVCSAVFSVERSHFDKQEYKETPFVTKQMWQPAGGELRHLHEPIYLSASHIEKILEYFELPSRFVPDAIIKHKGLKLTTPRHVAQFVGTELLREIDRDIHINMTLKLNSGSSAKFLICSDIRFQNELESIRNSHGLILGISRKAAVPGDLINLHPSEKEIPQLIAQADLAISNESTISELSKLIQTSAKAYLLYGKT